MKKIQFKVSVRCLTYNQAPYILDTLDGFAMQQTTFPFVCTIVDDYSSDGEQEAIQRYIEQNFDLSDANIAYQRETEYAHITFARHKTNLNCFFAILYLKYNHYSLKRNKLSYLAEWLDDVDYAALCEGDDYWIDPSKLQKQVDYLDAHPDCGLVHTQAKVYVEKSKSFTKRLIGFDFDDIDQLIVENKIATLTTCFRNDLYVKYKSEITPDPSWKMGDYPAWLYFAHSSKVHFINEPTAVYRVLENSASHNNSIENEINFHKSIYSISSSFAMKMHKEYLLHSIKLLYINRVISSYIDKNRKADLKLYRLIKSERCFSCKILIKFILLSTNIGKACLVSRTYR